MSGSPRPSPSRFSRSVAGWRYSAYHAGCGALAAGVNVHAKALLRNNKSWFMRIGTVLAIAALLTATACRHDPNELKRKYVQTGNKYFATGKYREASILYRSAIRRDARFAEAYYRWALAEIKLNQTTGAVAPLP